MRVCLVHKMKQKEVAQSAQLIQPTVLCLSRVSIEKLPELDWPVDVIWEVVLIMIHKDPNMDG